ncbi:MAG: glutamyl-tRNA reductase [Bacteroidota bacterium]
MKKYHIITVTHRNTKLNALGHFAMQSEEADLKADLEALKAKFALSELLYLATCNRIMYLFDCEQTVDTDFIAAFFCKINPAFSAIPASDFAEKVSVYHGEEAIQHLLEVAASIDSLVVGEREILRQLRDAYDRCLNWGLTGDSIRLAIKVAIESAKEVYAQTRIGEKQVSVVSLAIQKLLKANLPKVARILLVGAGQTNMLVTKFLLKHGYTNVVVFNRSLDKAEQLAEMLGSKALPLNALELYQEGFDCMIVCTGSNEPIIKASLYEKLLQGEQDQKLLVDLAIPNNIAGDVVDRFDTQYIEIEGLRSLAKENLNFREQEVVKGKALLARQIESFELTYQQRQIEKAMRGVPAEIKAVKAHAVNEVFKKDLESLDEQAQSVVARILDYMERQCISIPMKAAKNTVS